MVDILDPGVAAKTVAADLLGRKQPVFAEQGDAVGDLVADAGDGLVGKRDVLANIPASPTAKPRPAPIVGTTSYSLWKS